jgi:hypothetical protein
MVQFSVLLAATALAAFPAPDEDQIRAAIFDDIQLNALIGNGNALISGGWIMGYTHETTAPQIQIRDLGCPYSATDAHCDFALARLSKPTIDIWTGNPVPLLVKCKARLARTKDAEGGWSVVHTPPPARGDHSRTTMTCRKV